MQDSQSCQRKSVRKIRNYESQILGDDYGIIAPLGLCVWGAGVRGFRVASPPAIIFHRVAVEEFWRLYEGRTHRFAPTLRAGWTLD